MAKFLPERILPLRLANLGQRLIGCVALGQMSRLTGDSSQGKWPKGKGDVQVDLQFQRGEQSYPRMNGKFCVSLTFKCQRCLESVDIDVEATVDLGLVRESQQYPRDTDEDYLELSEESLDLTALVEDELILALPIIPTHPEGACQTLESIPRQSNESNESPFAVLSVLKSNSE